MEQTYEPRIYQKKTNEDIVITSCSRFGPGPIMGCIKSLYSDKGNIQGECYDPCTNLKYYCKKDGEVYDIDKKTNLNIDLGFIKSYAISQKEFLENHEIIHFKYIYERNKYIYVDLERQINDDELLKKIHDKLGLNCKVILKSELIHLNKNFKLIYGCDRVKLLDKGQETNIDGYNLDLVIEENEKYYSDRDSIRNTYKLENNQEKINELQNNHLNHLMEIIKPVMTKRAIKTV